MQCHLTPNRYTKIIEEYSAYGHQRVVMYRSEPDSNLKKTNVGISYAAKKVERSGKNVNLFGVEKFTTNYVRF